MFIVLKSAKRACEYCNRHKMTTKLKHLVSKRKRRFVEDGFDLDLTCILPQMKNAR